MDTQTTPVAVMPNRYEDMKSLRMNYDAQLAAEMLRKYDDAVNEVHTRLLQMASRFTRIASDMQNGRAVNQLGEIHSDGADLNRFCAIQNERCEAFQMIAQSEGVDDDMIGVMIENVYKRLAVAS